MFENLRIYGKNPDWTFRSQRDFEDVQYILEDMLLTLQKDVHNKFFRWYLRKNLERELEKVLEIKKECGF